MRPINNLKMSMKKLICKQVGGNHYQSDYQPLEFILKYDLNFIQGSIIKYVIRHKNKNKEVDLLKALSLCETGIEYDLKPSMTNINEFDINSFCRANKCDNVEYSFAVKYVLKKDYQRAADMINVILEDEY